MNITDFTHYPDSNGTYAKNEVPAFEITTQNSIRAVLSIGNEIIFKGSYAPDFSGKIIIDFAGMYDSYLSTMIPSADSNVIINTAYRRLFTATFDVIAGESTTEDPATVSWFVVNATLKASSSFDIWSDENFLTNQPHEKRTNYEAPEWLTYIDAGTNNRLVARFYPKKGGHSDVTVHTDTEQGCYSVNVRYSRIVRLQSYMPVQLHGYYDLILYNEKNKELARQRYIYEERSGKEKYYCFINSLGGVDTLICRGENVLSPETTHGIGRFNRIYKAIDNTDDVRQWRQNTGDVPHRHRNWIYELLTTKQQALKYDVRTSDYQPIVIASSDIAMSDSGQLASATFGYMLTDIENVIDETERPEMMLHNSIAMQAASLYDLTEKTTLNFTNGVTEEVIIPADKLYVSYDEALFTTSTTQPVYYFIDNVAAGNFVPGQDANPVIITLSAGSSIRFETQNENVTSLELSYYLNRKNAPSL